MKIWGTIIDAESGEPIESASIILTDKNGSRPLGPGTTTNSDGFFSLNSTLADQPDTRVEISSIGYYADIKTPADVQGGQFSLYPGTDASLDDVVITGRKTTITAKAKKVNYTPPIVLGAASIAAFATWMAYK